jgi:H+/Cl- antiporter ClcA
MGSILAVLVLSILCGLLSIVFCTANRQTGRLLSRWFPDPYKRIVAGGVLVIILYWCFGSSYLGAGGNIISQAIAGKAVWYAFLVKLLFTAVTLGSGYKGGEIVPAFFVGATFGCVIAPLLGLPASMGAAIGFICVFCGITNCPIASFLLSIEVFGTSGSLYFLGRWPSPMRPPAMPAFTPGRRSCIPRHPRSSAANENHDAFCENSRKVFSFCYNLNQRD